MPYINLQITKGATREQKARIVKEFTETLVNVLGKSRNTPMSSFKIRGSLPMIFEEVKATAEPKRARSKDEMTCEGKDY